MAKTRDLPLGWTTVITDSTTEVFVPAGDFGPVGGVTDGRGWLELRSRMGSMHVAPAVQMANDVRNPDATAVTLGITGGATGFANANGVWDPDTSLVTLAAAGKKFIRPGWLVKVTSGTGAARVRGMIQLFS